MKLLQFQNFAWLTIMLVFMPFHALPQTEEATDSNLNATPLPAIESSATPTESTKQRFLYQSKSLIAEANAGPTANWLEGDEPILAFYQADTSGQARGAVLMLHDIDHSPIWPETLLNMHRHLPQYGWSTLSIQLLNLPAKEIPARVTKKNNAENNIEENNQENLEDKPTENPSTQQKSNQDKVDETQVIHQESDQPEEEIKEDKATAPSPPKPSIEDVIKENQKRINAGIRYLHEQGQYNIALVGVGFGGYQSLQYVDTDTMAAPKVQQEFNNNKKPVIERSVRAVIIIDTKNHFERLPRATSQLFTKPEIPLLDITTQIDLNTRTEAKERKQAARKSQYQLYRQEALTPPDGLAYLTGETELTKTVRGFLTRFAAGSKL